MFESELEALQATFDQILGLPGTIASAFIAIVYILVYPFVLVINCAYNWIATLLGSYVSIFLVIIDAVDALRSILFDIFDGVLPSVWVGLMLVTISLNVGIRLYRILKGVSIFGWSL